MKQTFEKKELKKKSENLSDWYTDVILKAEVADYAPVKGCMVIRPYGYAVWERVQTIFNDMMQTRGVENAYFPLFIPLSLLEKEKEHVAGFSPELAVVTIGGGEKLKDPLVVRPTSETIMYAMYAKWVHSWRDLPVLINQWNNVVRWEKRTYLFLRTTEFLWQEGHTAHETEGEAMDMVLAALEWYRQVYEDYFAVPVVYGRKSESEKFAGGKATYAIEALMPDGKALQAATSHNLGQNFSKVFEIQFQNREGKQDFVWQTSWGLSTRSLGGLFLTHGDDQGLIFPPKIAPVQVVIMPIKKAGSDEKLLLAYCQDMRETLANAGIRIRVDSREEPSVGRRFNEWEVKGVPLRYEVGGKELADRTVTIARRDTGEKVTVTREQMLAQTERLIGEIQKALYSRAKKFLDENTRDAASYDEFKHIMSTTRGFIRALWCEESACEAVIKEETKASTRCLPLDAPEEKGTCVHCGKPAAHRWLFAQAY
ncbi:proline--tRNA ligase [Candidatus Gottesmanbacteria bacterium RIFCSPLOWO2_01_FULL_48_11]|uniref:Proline--tRNA ligase n=2 Tax=Candidatus Gottesmaniibacteriota TaxID=1752720 RepID=A0A0G1U0X2_9BACT|nr:MAG: Proline-tRNA ligase [Candidatus Gottesmanbacteria bacterium GW2011_GWA2_47_9]OGG27216.1 MAG: proline--tRNA ligase [Candidatus Gottesmanbacteria bacterium RIFCSPLOWO2_01_FULL_48_11]